MGLIVDPFGRSFPEPKRPETREIAAVSIRDRWSGYPSAGLTPGRLAAIFREADWGLLRNQAELFEEMEEKDAHLAAVMQTRRLAVLGLDFQIEDASESPEDKKIGEFCREATADLDLEELWTHLLGGVGQGYGGAEPIWENYPQALITRFNLIHPKNFNFTESLTPRIITENDSQGVDPGAFKLIFHKYAAKSGPAFRNGVLRVVGFLYLLKNYALKDWAVFNEIFGMPLRLGKYEPSASPADKEALRVAISSLGSDAAGIISKSTEIVFEEAAGRLSGTTIPYQVLADFCNREISKAVLGQTLTTDTTGSTGTYAAGKVQADVRRDLLEADAKALAKTMRLQVLRPLVGFNFGWDKPVPGCAFNIAEEEDLKALSETYKNVIGFGTEVSQEHVRERFGIPAPKDGETIIQMPKTPQDQGPGARGQGSGGEGPQASPLAPAEKAAMKAAAVDGPQAGTPAPLINFADNGAAEFGSLPEDQQLARVMLELENLSQAFQAAMPPEAAASMLAPLKAVIARDGTPAEIKAGLVQVMRDLNVSGYAEHLAQALVLAELKGRAQ